MTPEDCWKFLYYDGAIDPTMLMALNSLAAVHIKPKIEKVKQITQFLNYIESHPYTVAEYRRSRIILYIYSYESYIS